MDTIKQHMVQFSFWVRFSKCARPEGQAKELPELDEILTWFYPCPHANSTQKTPQMHSNTSPTYFEGPRGQKIGFRDPGPGNRV